MAAKSIVFITGANTGIGFETVKALLRSDRAYHILLGGRNIDKAQAAAESAASEISSTQSSIEVIQIDVEDDDSITKAFGTISASHDRVDTVVNNAGAQFDMKIQDGTMTARECWNKTYDVNVSGAQVVTQTFLPLLLKSKDPRLLFLTSGLASIEQAGDPSSPRYQVPPAGLPKQSPDFPDFGAYMASKTALNMMMVNWTRILKADGVKVWSIAPGFLATGFMGSEDTMKNMGAGEASIGGTVIRNVIEGKRDQEVGKVVREYGTPIQPW